MAVDPLATAPVGRRSPGSIAWWPLRHFLTKARDPKATPVWAIWLGMTAVSIAFAFLEARMNWSGMPVPFGGRTVGFTLYPPLAISAFVAFWLGPTYGATTAYVSTLVSGLVGGLDPGRAALFALGTPAEVVLLWFLSTILHVRATLREYRDWWRFFAAALIAVTASSLDIMLYNEAHRLSIADGQRLWEGWIFGDQVGAFNATRLGFARNSTYCGTPPANCTSTAPSWRCCHSCWRSCGKVCETGARGVTCWSSAATRERSAAPQLLHW